MNIKDIYIKSYIEGNGLAKKEAKNFRKASDWVLKGIFNTYRREPSFRKWANLDSVMENRFHSKGRHREFWKAINTGNTELAKQLSGPLSGRALRQAEFRKFKETLAGTTDGIDMFRPSSAIGKYPNLDYIMGPHRMPSDLLNNTLGTISGGFDPLVLRSLKLFSNRAPSFWTQVLGHEVGHGLLAAMRKGGDPLAFRRTVLRDFRALPKKNRTPALRYTGQSTNMRAPLLIPFDLRNPITKSKYNVANVLQHFPELDERAADAIGMAIQPGNETINRAITNHFNRYYRNVNGLAGWRARSLLNDNQ